MKVMRNVWMMKMRRYSDEEIHFIIHDVVLHETQHVLLNRIKMQQLLLVVLEQDMEVVEDEIQNNC